MSISQIHILFMLSGVMISLSASSPFVIWVGMEISTFFFLGTFFSSTSMVLSGWKYFIVQSVSSFFLYMGMVVGNLESEISFFFVLMSLMVKLGGFPAFGWVFHMSENLSWLGFFLLGSVQKVIPLILMEKFPETKSNLVFFLSLLSFLTVVFLFFNKMSIRWMMMSSSLFNLGWLMICSQLGTSELIIYLILYFSSNFIVIYSLSKKWESFSFSSFKLSSSSMKTNMLEFMSLLLLMGFPPFGTFLGKVEGLNSLIQSGFYEPAVIIIFISSVSMFFYLKLSYPKGVVISKSTLSPFTTNLSLFPLFILFLLFFLIIT